MNPKQIRDLYTEAIAVGLYEADRLTATRAGRTLPTWELFKEQDRYQSMGHNAVAFLTVNALLPTGEEQQGDYQIENGAGEIVAEHPGERRFVTPWKDIDRA